MSPKTAEVGAYKRFFVDGGRVDTESGVAEASGAKTRGLSMFSQCHQHTYSRMLKSEDWDRIE